MLPEFSLEEDDAEEFQVVRQNARLRSSVHPLPVRRLTAMLPEGALDDPNDIVDHLSSIGGSGVDSRVSPEGEEQQEFSPEAWTSDIARANGRLRTSVCPLPVRRRTSMLPERAGNEDELVAHEAHENCTRLERAVSLRKGTAMVPQGLLDADSASTFDAASGDTEEAAAIGWIRSPSGSTLSPRDSHSDGSRASDEGCVQPLAAPAGRFPCNEGLVLPSLLAGSRLRRRQQQHPSSVLCAPMLGARA